MPKNPHADFTPTLAGYSGISPFRFWCQTALPLTYDDSLSYYELLNKVVNYLNHTIEDLTNVENNTSELAEAYEKLQKYVNDYFDDIDIEAELRNVLDKMAEDGTLDALLDPLVENQLPGVVDEKIDGVVASQIDEAVADQIDESVADQLPAIVENSVPGEVSDWLTENVDPVGSAVVVDSSLTISGAAADAKVTGDAVSDLKESLDHAVVQFPELNGVILPPAFDRLNRYVNNGADVSSANVQRLSFDANTYIALLQGDEVNVDTSVISAFFGGYSTDGGSTFTTISSVSGGKYYAPADGIYFFTLLKPSNAEFTEADVSNGWKYITFNRIENTKHEVDLLFPLYNKTLNLPEILTQSGAIYANGNEYNTDSFKRSDFIPVKAGQVYSFKLKGPNDVPSISYYTKPLSSTINATYSVLGDYTYHESEWTAPANGYIRIVNNVDFATSGAYFYLKNGIEYNIVTLLNDVSAIKTKNTEQDGEMSDIQAELTNTSKNVFSLLGAITENGFLVAGGTVNTNAAYRTTGFIPVKANIGIKYNIQHGTTLPIICFYTSASAGSIDTSKTVTGQNGYTSGIFTPASDGYIRVTYIATSTGSTLEFTSIIPDNVKSYVDNKFANNYLKNLNILCLGDSIFGNDNEICEYLKEFSGANVINGAVGGTRVSDRGGTDPYQWFDGVNLATALTTGTWTQQEAAVEQSLTTLAARLAILEDVDMSEIDLITMDWGTNDYAGSVALADIISAYNTVIDTIQSHYPAIRFLIITPIWRYFRSPSDNENGDNYSYNDATLKEIAEAIDENAKNKRIESLQMYQKMPLNYNTASLYFDSGSNVHLNATGNLVYAHILHGKIQSMY